METSDSYSDLTVMIIEDDLILTLSLELVLKKIGFDKFIRADTGEMAVELAMECKPDLLLVDIYLGPGITGVDAVKQIQDKMDIPVIYITGNSDEKNKSKAGTTDHYDYLIKPITSGDIQRSIGKIWPVSVSQV